MHLTSSDLALIRDIVSLSRTQSDINKDKGKAEDSEAPMIMFSAPTIMSASHAFTYYVKQVILAIKHHVVYAEKKKLGLGQG
jgi:hypothetical protein